MKETKQEHTLCTYEQTMDYFLLFDCDGKQFAKVWDEDVAKELLRAVNSYDSNNKKIEALLDASIIALEAFKHKRGQLVIDSCIYELEKAVKLAEAQ